MNFSKEDIVSAYKHGKSFDEIAEELAATLNSAKDEIEAEDEKNKTKIFDADAVAQSLNYFLKTYYNATEDLYSSEDIIDFCDNTNFFKNGYRYSKTDVNKVLNTADKILSNWIKSL